MADRQKVKLPPGFILDLDQWDRAQQKLPPGFLVDRIEQLPNFRPPGMPPITLTPQQPITQKALTPPPFQPQPRDWTISMTERPKYTGVPVFNPLAGIAKSWESLQSLASLLNPESTWQQRAGDASTIIRNTGEQALPRFLPGIAANPGRFLPSIGMGMTAQNVIEEQLRNTGADPRVAALGGDVAGLGLGFETVRLLPGGLPRGVSLRDFMQGQQGEITYGPSQGWTSTLRDLIEQKAPGKVSPQQLRGIASQAPKEELQWSNLSSLMEPEMTTRYTRPVDETNLLDIVSAPTETVELPLQKGRILEQFKGPPIQEVLRTPPDTKFSSYTLPGGEKSHELLFTIPREVTGGRTHTTPHWQEENVFAHVRFNDRLSPEGKKVLFLEELQSDWHQAGREKGYVDPKASQKLHLEYLDAQAKGSAAYNKWRRLPEELRRRDDPGYQEYVRMQDKATELYNQWKQVSQGPPAAPFSKDWHELLMKRMLKEAVDKGYDKLAWTTGQQQNQRYDLSKTVNKIVWRPQEMVRGRSTFDDPHPDDTYQFAADLKNGDSINLADGEPITFAELRRHIGADAADRALKTETQRRRGETPRTYISGEDLKVGGEGMKGFYDKILPDFARKYGKKFGATVSQGEINVPHMPDKGYRGPQYTREQFYDWIKAGSGNERWHAATSAVLDAMDAGQSFQQAMSNWGTRGLASELGGEIVSGAVKVHSIDITPAMREAPEIRNPPMFGMPRPGLAKKK